MFLQGKIIKDKCSKGCLSEQLHVAKRKNSLSIIMFDFDSSQSDDHF